MWKLVLLGIHAHAVTTFGHKCCLALHTGSLQHGIELHTLAAGHHIVLLAMEDDNRHIGRIDIMRCAQTDILVGLVGQPSATQENILRARRSEGHMLAAFHVGEIDRTRPVARRVDETALVGVVAHSTFDVDALLQAYRFGG